MAFPYRKVMCPVDFDDNSLQALDQAIEIARHFKATIAVVHIVPIIEQFSDFPVPYDLYAKQASECRARLAEIATSKLSGIEHESAVYTGDVAGCILEAAHKINPDVLVMATHGRGGLAHFFLGSVAEQIVRRADCHVLTIHALPAGNPA